MGNRRYRLIRCAAPITALALTAACSGGPVGAPLSELQPAATVTVKPGDVVAIAFWEEQGLSGEHIVDDNGFVHLPLLRGVHVADMSAEAIRERLTELYSEYYTDPLLVVNVKLGVSITGEVTGPGRYTVDPAFNVLDLIGTAGGLRYDANREDIELNRGGQRYIINLDDALLATAPEKLRLQSGDWIYVPRRFWTLSRTLAYSSILLTIMLVVNLTR